MHFYVYYPCRLCDKTLCVCVEKNRETQKKFYIDEKTVIL